MVQENSLKKVLVICGPTASGKTSLAVECAKLLDGEVISADSMCIYKKCDIGTAKPTKEEMQGVPHHMIDVVSPFENYSVGDYKEQASSMLSGIIQRGKIPVICGGTGFYINSLLYDLSYGNTAASPKVRKFFEEYLLKNGKESLHSLLNEKDPETASVLHVNDTKRVIRALEIFECSGKKKSDLNDEFVPKYDYQSYSIDYPREHLYDRINKRVDIMLSDGLIEEVKTLLAMGVTPNNQCMQGIGYKEVCQGLEVGLSTEEIGEIIKFNTRHYAKRQITFFKRDAMLALLNPDDVKGLACVVAENFNKVNF